MRTIRWIEGIKADGSVWNGPGTLTLERVRSLKKQGQLIAAWYERRRPTCSARCGCGGAHPVIVLENKKIFGHGEDRRGIVSSE